MTRIELYDTTLRDGMQGEGMSLSAQEKLRVVHRLDEFGIDVIEAGFASSNPKEQELFDLLATEPLRQAQIAAFGMTRRRDIRAQEDPALRVLADGFTPVCTLVGKTWSLHLEKVVKVDREENLRMIEDSVAFLVAAGKRVIYDAEHFFDGYAEHPGYALRCLRAAAQAGAQTVVCCDTNGGTLPQLIASTMAAVVQALSAEQVTVGIHCHDDAGCGVANTLAAVQNGASHVQGTINGYGERCGNANLITVIANLQLKLGYECLTDAQLASLTPTAHFFDELLNFNPDPDQPYVGRNAFAHKGGMHVAGVTVDPLTFEHIDPEVVGNRREVLISELSGKGPCTAERLMRASRSTTSPQRGSSRGSRNWSTAAISTRRPTARSSCCCARRRATTNRCSGSNPGARSSNSAPTGESRPRRRSRSGWTVSATFALPRATAPSTRWTVRCAMR